MHLMKQVPKRHAMRRKRGSSFIEVGIASIGMAVVVFMALDMYIWIQAFMLLDLATRDACRAAAQAQAVANTPAAYRAAAVSAATRELELHSQNRGYIGNPTLVPAGFGWVDYGASNGGSYPPSPQTPYVRVQCSMNVNLPIPIFMGTQMQGGALVFQRTYCMPIVNLPPP